MDFSRKEKDTPSSSLLTSYRNQNTPDTSLRKHAATSTPPNTVLRGILSKKGRNKLYQPWAIRTVILDDESTLRYFDGQSLRGEVDVVGCFLRTLTPDQADGRSHAFEIANISEKGALKSSSLILAASSALEAQAWMDALITASHQTKKKIEPTARSNYSYESLDQLAKQGGGVAMTPIDARKLKEERKLRQKQLQDAEEDEENVGVNET